jgi:probable HAF family extracellular repeat protein
VALGMNNAGTIVGTGKSVAIGAQWQGWYGTVGGPLIKLIPPASGNDGSAFDINDGGLITGYYNRFGATIYPENVAYIFNTHTSQWTEIGLGVGRAINESGEVAGTLAKSNCGHAFVYRNGVTTDIGTLGGNCSYALAINDHGNVAGNSLIAPNPEYRPFLFNGAMQDVIDLIPANDPYKTAAEITEATGINNDGFIVVNGLDKLNFDPNAPLIRRAWLLRVPQVYFDGGIQNFGEIPAGSTSATKTITLTNKEAANATLNFILMR